MLQTFYTGFSIKQYKDIVAQKSLVPNFYDDKKIWLVFSEDISYWQKKIEEQKDEDDIHQYQYSLVISFDIESSYIHHLMDDPQIGRLSQKIYDYYTLIHKETTIPKLLSDDRDILAVMDVYESPRTHDGISQVRLLLSHTVHDIFWKDFCRQITSIKLVGGIPGAKELTLSH